MSVYVVRVCMYACSTYGVLGDSVSVYLLTYTCSNASFIDSSCFNCET